MSFKVDADLVALFKGLVISLKPYASAQDVDLSFESTIQSQYSYYHPKDIIPEFAKLLSLIISFTPQSYNVHVSFDKDASNEDYCSLQILNTGVNLSHVTEILKSVTFQITVEDLNPESTLFKVSIPILSSTDSTQKHAVKSPGIKEISPYYLEIGKRLKSYFGNIDELEAAALRKGFSEGVFLKKVNASITSNIHDNDFKVDLLAASVALSSTQLFRKIKMLTKMSPGRYILFYRLHRAKELLQSKDRELNVSEVCYQVGFVSKSHFTRSFHKEFGFNPSNCK